ncbi:RINT1-like protein MAG2L [Actinidia eriantha]|uniref:RINT1-like protein MAG2L n=1 Tax=Actinidia eriantha TaxID=165200 RepID=UPI002587D257|nr:RINT1-like protein MAG2L [Actinidia eriantha]
MMAMDLPDHRDLSPNLLGFLHHNFTTNTAATDNHRHHFTLLHDRACDLAEGLTAECAESDAHLLHLQQNLPKLLISWISRSIAAKTALHSLTRNRTSPFGIGSMKIQRILSEDLPQLARELKRIDDIRSYADTTLQLEAMVGDLEDAVLSFLNSKTGKALAANCSDPLVLIGHGSRQEKFFQAVRSMNDIEELLISPVKFQPQWCHLMKSVDSRVNKILTVLRPQFLADHRALLSSLGWPPKVLTSTIGGKISALPNPLLLMQEDKKKAYSASFQALCALQHLQARREKRQLDLLGQKKKLSTGLWAIDELVSPIASRIEHHFSKWADQPEFVFALVYKVTRDFIGGVDDVLQPLIDRAKLVSFSAKEAWVSAMVHTLSEFLAERVFPVLSERYNEKKSRLEVISSWLHLIDLMVNFDKQILSLLSSESYLFLGDSKSLVGSSRALYVFSLFSDRPDYLKIWAKIELKEGKRKLKAELRHERAWLVSTKLVGSIVDITNEQFVLYTREDHKAPLIAESALKLAWEMIERCRTLPDILARILFIRSTAAKLLWYFFHLLLLQYKSTKLLATDCDNDSLPTLCGVINAARYCEYKLQQWSDDVNFLEMRIAENDTSTCVKVDANDDFYFFGGEIKSLADLEMNLIMEIISGLLYHFERLTHEYVQNEKRFEQEGDDVGVIGASEGTDFLVSVDFIEALDTLRNRLCVIYGSLNPKDFSDLWRSVADGLDRFISASIFMSDYRFSEKGISQLGADMRALFHVFKPFCDRPEAFFPRIRNSLKLLEMDRQDLGRLQFVSSNSSDRTRCLHFCGITQLSFDQADKILRNRN